MLSGLLWTSCWCVVGGWWRGWLGHPCCVLRRIADYRLTSQAHRHCCLTWIFCVKHGDPAADQIVRGPSGGCRGDLISTPDSGYYRVFYKSFLSGNSRFGGCFEKPSLQALFWCKNFRSRKRICKVTKRRRSAKPTCVNGGTNRANGGTNASFCTLGDFQFFLARGQVCFEFDSATVKREKKRKIEGKLKTVAKGKEKRFL